MSMAQRLLVSAAGILFISIPTTHAQHHDHGSTHAEGHAFYQNWVNGERNGCCNDKDCDAIPESDQRTVNGYEEVFIRGVGVAKGQASWCRVERRHMLTQGNAPNWNAAHACITDYYKGTTPCEQFICYQPKPGL